MAETKTCRICKEDKPPEEFYIRDAAKGTRRSECKACDRAVKRGPRDQKKRKASQRAYYQRNPRKTVQGYNERTMDAAVQHRVEWSALDNRTVMREDLSLTQIAWLLGRTYSAVSARRTKLRRELKEEARHG